MLNTTLNSSPQLIRTKNLYSDGDELSVVDCTLNLRTVHLIIITSFRYELCNSYVQYTQTCIYVAICILSMALVITLSLSMMSLVAMATCFGVSSTSTV